MTISTLTELESLPIGTFVRVGTDSHQIFERTNSGFGRDGATIDISAFSGAVNAGLVNEFDMSVNVGDWYQSTSYTNRATMVVDRAGSGRWHVLNLRNGTYYSMTEVNVTTLLDMTKVPAPTDTAPALLSFAQAQVGTHSGLPLHQVADLHSFAEDNAGTDMGDRFEDLLTSIGYGRGADHQIIIAISGTSTVTPSRAQARLLVGDGFTATSVQRTPITVSWTKEVTVTRHGIGCQCSTITDADVAPHLPKGTTVHEWTVRH